MTGYRIAAIPTVYNGRKYRSRLEAKWAAFFDLLGWQHEYEPFDLGKWSPDFLIKGSTSLLTEVKPLTDWDKRVGEKLDAATRGKLDRAKCLLVLGVAPQRMEWGHRIGWVGEPSIFDGSMIWVPVYVGWVPDLDRPQLSPDIVYRSAEAPNGEPVSFWYSCISNGWGDDAPPPPHYTDHVIRLWAQAANAVQWHPQGAA